MKWSGLLLTYHRHNVLKDCAGNEDKHIGLKDYIKIWNALPFEVHLSFLQILTL